MKKLKLFLLLIIGISLISSCTDNRNVHAILNNKTARNMIMDSISNNTEMMSEMIEHIMQNTNAMQTMTQNPGMLNNMMQNGDMMAMMRQHPQMWQGAMQNMMNMAIQDTALSNSMGQMFMQHPQMMSMMQGVMSQCNNLQSKGSMMQGKLNMGGMHH